MTKEIGINQLKRRDFLRAGLVFGAGAAGLAAGYAAVPDAFARAVYAAKREGMTNDNVLVMIQLAGGNDGLRTLVPLADPSLHDLRPKLAGPMVSQALPLNSQYGLNHNLGQVKSLWDEGKVAIVQGVGYPNPTFSHFESIRIWETGDPNAPAGRRLARPNSCDRLRLQRTSPDRLRMWSDRRPGRVARPAGDDDCDPEPEDIWL